MKLQPQVYYIILFDCLLGVRQCGGVYTAVHRKAQNVVGPKCHNYAFIYYAVLCYTKLPYVERVVQIDLIIMVIHVWVALFVILFILIRFTYWLLVEPWVSTYYLLLLH